MSPWIHFVSILLLMAAALSFGACLLEDVCEDGASCSVVDNCGCVCHVAVELPLVLHQLDGPLRCEFVPQPFLGNYLLLPASIFNPPKA